MVNATLVSLLEYIICWVLSGASLHFLFNPPTTEGIVPTLQMNKLRLREVQQLWS